MNIIRNIIDSDYEVRRSQIFERTKDDPEIAHVEFIKIAKEIHDFRLEGLLFNCSENRDNPGFEISNAAGFNKNGDIPPTFLKYLGFDRVVVGTVTADPWKGNSERPRIWRFPETASMVNYLGLPGEGAETVAENISRYRKHRVPLTVSLMSTPGKTGDDALKDVRKTVRIMRDAYGVDRFQFNGSCPNTQEAENMLEAYLQSIREGAYPYQTIEIKVSPDIDEGEAEKIIKIGEEAGVRAIVTTNTAKVHDSNYIPNSPGKGGASGHAVYDISFEVQKMMELKLDEINSGIEIVAVGGIDSAHKARERTSSPRAKGIELYTGLIYRGPKLLRELRMANRIE